MVYEACWTIHTWLLNIYFCLWNLIFIYEISFSFMKFHFGLSNFFAILGYEICILGYQIWISNTKSRFRKIKVKGIRRIYVLFFQLWRLVFLEPPGVLRHIVPHFKGLISADWNLKSSRAWQHFYLLPRPFEKGHFRGKKGKSSHIHFL